MTRREEIAVIKQCEKAIYDRRRRLEATTGDTYLSNGIMEAEITLYCKRERLERRLKK